MKKTLLLILAGALLSVMTTTAQKRSSKYQGEFKIGYSLIPEATETHMVSLETVHGARLNDYVFLGVGLAWNGYIDTYDYWYDSSPEVYSFVPVFFNVKFYAPGRKVSPYLSLDAGYAFSPDMYLDNGGMYLCPGVGVNFRTRKSHSFNLGLSLRNQFVGGVWAEIFSIGISGGITF